MARFWRKASKDTPFEAELDASLELEAGNSPAQLENEIKSESQKTFSAAQSRVVLLVCGHSLCASGLLVINKWALKVFPWVWILTSMQFASAAALVFIAGKLRIINVEPLELLRLRQFFPAAGMFFIAVTAGNKIVGVSNVDTFIVIKSVVPIPCAILESLMLKEPCPAPRSWLGLVIILVGACAYACMNQGIMVGSVSWVVLWMLLMPLDSVLIKHLVSASELSPWGLVLYNNVCAVIPGLFFSVLLEANSSKAVKEISMALADSTTVVAIVISCWSGLAISFFQLNVRKVISASAFAVLGVSNKLLSVMMNQIAQLDANRDLASVFSVIVSIIGAIFFQQTVKGKGISQAPRTDATASNNLACFFVLIGMIGAAILSYESPASHPR